MAAKRVKVPVSQLTVGVFVSDLDRPWVETPFPIQGFYIRHARDVEALESYCKFVYIDRELVPDATAYEPVPVPQRTESGTRKSANVLMLPPVVIRNRQNYQAVSSIKKETAQAERLHARVQSAMQSIVEKLASGNGVDLSDTTEIAADMVESVIRNPDALLWMTRVKDRCEHSYQHAIHASVWALVFGRHLGLERSLLKTLASGVLLSQVGKAKLPKELLDKQGMLKPEEFEHYKTFVELGVAILEQDAAVPRQVVSVVEYHRERHNGSGFPKGVTGEKVPLLAKIAAIVDHYQELIEPRGGVTPLTSLEAISRLYESRNIEFQEDLVEQFIQAVGIYPTGTLVELSSQEVGVVIGQNPERKLWPKVMILLDREKTPLKQGKVVDLMGFNERAEQKEKLNISNSLPVGAFEIDPSRFQVTGATNKWSLRHLVG